MWVDLRVQQYSQNRQKHQRGFDDQLLGYHGPPKEHRIGFDWLNSLFQRLLASNFWNGRHNAHSRCIPNGQTTSNRNLVTTNLEWPTSASQPSFFINPQRFHPFGGFPPS
jgi:hypothetical protein